MRVLASGLLCIHPADVRLVAHVERGRQRKILMSRLRRAMSEIYEQQADIGHRNRTLHIHPPLLAASLLVFGLFLHLIGGDHQHAFPFHQLFGLLVAATGTGLMCYAAALFAAGDTTKNPYGEPAAFVVAPPFTVTRNPMYVGLTAILFSLATFLARR